MGESDLCSAQFLFSVVSRPEIDSYLSTFEMTSLALRALNVQLLNVISAYAGY